MSEKKFEITYGDEAKKVIGPFIDSHNISYPSITEGDDALGIQSMVRKVAMVTAEKYDAEVYARIIDVAREQGYMSVVILDKQTLAAKLGRLEPKEIVVHGYRPGRAVNSISYTCPTCGAHIGRYPFCKYCGQALKIEN